MKPFAKILVPHDFSEHAASAVEVAADLARRYEASVTLLHVYESMVYAMPESFVVFPPAQLAGLMGELEKHLQNAKQQAVALKVERVDTKLVQGAPVQSIVQVAHDGGYDLIVMGTHGRTGISHALIGSVAERVVRKAGCPVLTVRTQSPEKKD